MNSIKKPIVIVGCGFAGINTALSLKKLNPFIPILVIDSQSQFIFKPLLYEVLSDEIRSWEVAPKLETIFKNSRIIFLKNQLISINFSERSLKFHDQLEINYELLVLCTGSIHNNFSLPGVDENCYFFNNLDDKEKLKLFLNNSVKNKLGNNLAIIGAGPSGVELACKVNDLYDGYFKICIIEKSQEILSNNKIFNREEAEKAIQKRNIKILLNTTVESVSKDGVKVLDDINNSKFIASNCVIWTAGIKPNLPLFSQEVKLVNQRILIDKYLQMKSFPNIFPIGDISIIEGHEDLPVTAQVAMQQGFHVAKNLNLMMRNEELLPFEYQDNGEMISLGIGEASISGLGLTISGKLAFEIRRLIYASKMPILEKTFKSAASWILDKKSFISALIKKNN